MKLGDNSRMASQHGSFQDYYAHLNNIRLSGRLYKRLFTSPILYLLARRFGPGVLEVGCGIGNGVLGTFPSRVDGLDINPLAVQHCQAQGWRVQCIAEDGRFPVPDGGYSACVLDNVLEHIEDPRRTLDECHRATVPGGGLVVAVPGAAGYAADDDHKRFYGAGQLRDLDPRWRLTRLFATPSLVRSDRLSQSMRQYCLVASYQKT